MWWGPIKFLSYWLLSEARWCPCTYTFQHLHGLNTGQSYCGSESLESLVAFLDAFSKEGKPLGLQVSWTKTKTQLNKNIYIIITEVIDEISHSKCNLKVPPRKVDSCTYVPYPYRKCEILNCAWSPLLYHILPLLPWSSPYSIPLFRGV